MRICLITVLVLLVLPRSASAQEFIDWWLTPDQQGRYYFEKGDYLKAARSFEQPLWKAISFYKSGDFTSAQLLFEGMETAEGYFYLGNTLARQENLAQSAEAYRKALEKKNDFSQALFNLEWVEGLLELEKKQYEDQGGTGGKLGADRIVFDERGAKGEGKMTARELQAQKGLTDVQLREMWMRRVQTTPGDFLAFKFQYQLQQSENKRGEEKR